MRKITPQQAENLRIWIKALRSRQYKKGMGALCEEYNGTCRWCCLGIAVDVTFDGDWLAVEKAGLSYWKPDIPSSDETSVHYPSRNWFKRTFGICGERGLTRSDLASMNDQGISFQTIADDLEEFLRRWKPADV